MKSSGLPILFIGSYPPPENSEFGRNSIEFFEHITSILFKYPIFDIYVIAGDMNTRIGDKKDLIKDIDNVEERHILGFSINNHGKD